jgi:iron(III) transport system permease protein
MATAIQKKLNPQRVSQGRITQQQVALPAITLITAFLVVAPLLILFRTSLLPPGSLPFDTVKLTLSNFFLAYVNPATLRLLYNTVLYASGSVLLGLIIACALAWLLERTDLPFRTTIRVMTFAKMPVPPLAFVFGWILLFNPNNGALNILLKNLLGLEASPVDVYTLWMMIFIAGTGIVPTMFVMLSGVFRNMDPQLEDAGAVSGANFVRTIGHITLPLLSPGVLSVGIYMLMIMVQAFEGPLAIGLTAGVPVLSVYIYVLSSPEGGTPRYGLAAAFGIGLLVLALLLMWGYYRATRASERFRVVTGKGFRPRRIKLGRWRYPALGFVAVYFGLMILPLLILVWTSFLPFYQVPSTRALGVLTLDSYRSLFDSVTIRRALGNTFLLVFAVSTLTMVLSSLISWFATRTKLRIGRWLDTLAFAPLAIPNIVIAISILLLYIRTPLYGSIWVIVLAQVTAYLAFGTRTMNAALIQIHPELENAATACGASWITMMRKILLPMLFPHFLNGWLWVVAHSMRDLTIALTLMSPDSIVVSSMLWLLWSFGDAPSACALLILMVAGLLVLVLPIQIYASRSSETTG